MNKIFLFSVIVILFSVEGISQTLPNLIPMLVDGSFGYCNQQGEMVIPAEYERAEPFVDGLAKVRKNRMWGLIDESGLLLTPCMYYEIGKLDKELIRISIEKPKAFGFIDRHGEEAISPKFRFASEFQEGRAYVLNGRLYGYIDETGEIVISAKYPEANLFVNGTAVVGKSGKYQLIDMEGKPVIPGTFKYISNIFNDFITFKSYGKYGIIHKDMEKVSEEIYDNCYPFSDDGTALVCVEGKWGTINTDFKEVIPFTYESMRPFNIDVTPAKLNGKWGLIDKAGNTVVDFIYDDLNNFTKDAVYTAAKLGNKWGYIDTAGNVVIDFQFDDYALFVDGLAQVKENYKYGYMNTKGEVVIPVVYDDVDYYFTNGLSKVMKGDLRFYIDFTGKEYVK